MTTTIERPRTPTEFYDKIYAERKPSQHEWVAGTASPELVKFVWDGTLQPGMDVLEIGCGVGTESVFMACRGMNVSGVDLSNSAVALCNKLADFYGVKANFQQGSALDLPFEEGKFDAVCDQGVFHHLPDEARDVYAQSVSRVLKPGGMLLLRSFSDKIPGGPQPRRVKSRELTDTLLPYFDLELMERVLSFSTSTREKPLGWNTIWIKR